MENHRLGYYTLLFIILTLSVMSLTHISCSEGDGNIGNNIDNKNDSINNPSTKYPVSDSLATRKNNNPSVLVSLQEELSQSISDIKPSLVSVSTKKIKNIQNVYNASLEDDTIIGSGFIISEEGHILTANHVIKNSNNNYVYLNDNTEHKAEVIGKDHSSDIALLKIDLTQNEQVYPISFGDSDIVRDGDIVLAFGNPFGLLRSTSFGIVSSAHRKQPFNDDSDNTNLYYIQTDAPINTGNSGGPLVNIYGQVIGVIVSVLSFDDKNTSGIGFAVPINYAERVFHNLALNKPTNKVFSGIITTDDIVGTYEYNTTGHTKGAQVVSVLRGSPAHKSGIHKYDTITSINNKNISDGNHLHSVINTFNEGDFIKLNITRNNSIITTKFKIKKENIMNSYQSDHFIGLLVTDTEKGQGPPYNLPKDTKGVLVLATENGSPSQMSNIIEGDVIVSIDYKDILNTLDYNRIAGDIDMSKDRYLIGLKTYKYGLVTNEKTIYVENKNTP